jgi:tetratricopeptide (TPR) repeat protein
MAVQSLADDFDLERRLTACRALADAGEVWGNQEARDSALADALRLLGHAVVQTDGERQLVFRLAYELGEDAARLGCHRLAREALTKASEEIAPLGQQPGVALALCDIGHTYLAEGNPDEALSHFRAALDALDLDPPGKFGFELLATLGDAESRWGEEECCESALQAALKLLLSASDGEGDDDDAWVALAADSLADMAAQLGHRQAAVAARRLAGRLSGELSLFPPSEDG